MAPKEPLIIPKMKVTAFVLVAPFAHYIWKVYGNEQIDSSVLIVKWEIIANFLSQIMQHFLVANGLP